MLTTNNHHIISIFINTIIGYLTLFSIDHLLSSCSNFAFVSPNSDSKSNIVYESIENLSFSFMRLCNAVAMMIISILIIRCNKNTEKMFSISFIVNFIAVTLCFGICMFKDGNNLLVEDKTKLQWLQIVMFILILIPSVAKRFEYVLINSVPYYLLRNVTPTNHFGVSIGYLNIGIALSQLCSQGLMIFVKISLGNSLINDEKKLDNYSDIELDFIISRIIYVLALCFIGFVVSRLMRIRYVTHQQIDYENFSMNTTEAPEMYGDDNDENGEEKYLVSN